MLIAVVFCACVVGFLIWRIQARKKQEAAWVEESCRTEQEEVKNIKSKAQVEQEEADRFASLSEDERNAYKRQLEQERAERAERLRQAAKETEEQERWGKVNAVMICPHCQVKGGIRTKQISTPGSLAPKKAAKAALIGGAVGVLVAGMRTEDVTHTQAHCSQCTNTWVF
nr:hypothetical protein [uncultured Holophaga sp.]